MINDSMAFKDQLCLLLWKNWTLRKRQPLRIIIELVWPLILFLILMWVKLDSTDLRINRHECHFEEKAMPSAGMWPFLRSLVCSTNNTCHKNITYDYESKYEHYSNSTLDFINVAHIADSITELNNLLENFQKNDFLNKFENYLELFKDVVNEMKKCSFDLEYIFIYDNIKKQVMKNNLFIKDETIDLLKGTKLNFTKFYELFSLSERISSPSEIYKFLKFKLCNETITPFGIFTNNQSEILIMRDICNKSQEEVKMFLHILAQNTNKGFDLYGEISPCLGDNIDIFDLLNLQNDIQTVNEDFENLRQTRELLSLIRERLGEINTNKTKPTIERVSNFLCGRSGAFKTGSVSEKSYITKIQSRVKNKQPDDDDEAMSTLLTSEKLKNITNITSSYIYDNTTSEFCNQIFYTLEDSNNPALRMLWRQMKPIVRGSILYMPDTPTVNQIIKKSNWTFEFFSKIYKIIDQWNIMKPLLHEFTSNGSTLNTTRMLFNLVYLFNESIIPYPAKYIYGENLEYLFETLDSIVKNSLSYIKCFNFDKFRQMKSEENLVNTGLALMDQQLFWAGIVFDEVNLPETNFVNKKDIPNYVSFKIRMNSDKIDWTVDFKVKDRFWEPIPRSRPNDMKYLFSGFAYLQDMIEQAIIAINSDNHIPGLIVQQFPYPCYIEDRFMFAISRTMPLFMVLAWIFSVSMMVKSIVYEKEQRLKEFMKISGLSNYVHWFAWFISSLITMLISIILLCVVLKVGGILEYTSTIVIFFFICVFSVAMICESFLFSALFNKANLAAACAAIFYFIGYLPYALCVQWEEFMLFWHKCIASLSCTVAFGFGCSYFSRYERMAVGSQWSNIWMSPIPEDDFNMGYCIIMMLVDSALYLIATLYIEAVFPGEYGVAENWFFFVDMKYWFPDKYVSKTFTHDHSNNVLLEPLNNDDNKEANPIDRPLGVSIINLKKKKVPTATLR